MSIKSFESLSLKWLKYEILHDLVQYIGHWINALRCRNVIFKDLSKGWNQMSVQCACGVSVREMG